MHDQEKDILIGTFELVQKIGIKGLTMDDVAKNFGISKKTLYKYVSNKPDLIDKSVKLMFTTISGLIYQAVEESENAIDELLKIESVLSARMKETMPAMIFQLKQSAPKTFKWLEAQKENLIVDLTKKNLTRGISEELYRKDFSVEIISQLYYARILTLTQGDFFPDHCFNASDVEYENTIYHIRGLASPTGLNYLEKTLEKQAHE